MKKLLSILFLLTIYTNAFSQKSNIEETIIDTIKLDTFISQKIVAYKLPLATVFLNYDQFKTSIEYLLADYKNHPPAYIYESLYRRLKKSHEKGLNILNNIVEKLNNQIKTTDTIFLVHKPLDDETLWGWDLNKIITSQIEKNNCAIVDKKNNIQKSVIRVQGSWDFGSGGRRYHLPKEDKFFIDQMTWIR